MDKLHNMKLTAHTSTLHELRIKKKKWAAQGTCMEEMIKSQNTYVIKTAEQGPLWTQM